MDESQPPPPTNMDRAGPARGKQSGGGACKCCIVSLKLVSCVLSCGLLGRGEGEPGMEGTADGEFLLLDVNASDRGLEMPGYSEVLKIGFE